MQASPIARLAEGARAFERAWLSWSMPPPRVAIAESLWQPEGPDASCPRCGASAAPGTDPAGAGPCTGCRGDSMPYARLVRLGPFEGDLADWIRAIKYRRWEPMAVELGRRLGESIARVLTAGERPIVVPMPMPLFRRLQRGTDHTASIASAVAAVLRGRVRNLLAHTGGGYNRKLWMTG